MVDININNKEKKKKNDDGLAIKYIMGGLVLICFFMTAAYINTPTKWSVSINMDDNTLEAVKTAERIQEGNLELSKTKDSYCSAYANMSQVMIEYRNSTIYYFINNRWIEKETLWGSCLQ